MFVYIDKHSTYGSYTVYYDFLTAQFEIDMKESSNAQQYDNNNRADSNVQTLYFEVIHYLFCVQICKVAPLAGFECFIGYMVSYERTVFQFVGRIH